MSPLALAWAGGYCLFREIAARKLIECGHRTAFILATIVWGAEIVSITEIVSLFHALNRPALLLAWFFACGGVWFGFAWLARRRSVAFRHAAAAWLLPKRKQFLPLASWPMELRLMLYAAALLVFFLGGVALLTPTTNWDSLTYHLPRVMHWIQQQSVQDYRTGCVSQLQMGPWSAFLQTHLFLLWGSDRLANLVQWAAMVGCLIAGSLIARQLSNDERHARLAQVLTVLLLVTLPTALVESITSQTDYVTTFWFAGLTSLLLSLTRDPFNRWYLFGAAAACGLGLLTKITFILYAAPMCFLAAIWLCWRWRNVGQIACSASLFLMIVMLVILPHAWRNYEVFGSPIGSKGTQEGGESSSQSIAAVASNIIRNATLHTNTGIPILTRSLNRLLLMANSLTGRDLRDPTATSPPGSFKFLDQFTIYDSETGNPYHGLLILLAFVLAVGRPGKNAVLLGYLVLLATGYFLFCTVLRWQQWNSRYHLGYFVLAMPAVAIVLTTRAPRWLINTIAAGLVCFAGVVVAANQSRPVFNPAYEAQPRFRKMLFEQGPLFCEQLETLAADIVATGCPEAGLKLNSDDAEYAFWVALRNAGFTGRLDHFYVENESARIPSSAPTPCALISMSKRPPPPETNQILPYRFDYGLMTVQWSEATSHWKELVQFDFATQTPRRLSQADHEIAFDRRLIHLYLRTPRPGVLRLSGLVTGAGIPLENNQLRVMTFSGFQKMIALDGRPVSVTIPATGGKTIISLAVMTASAETAGLVRWEQLQWSWEPGARK